MLTKMIIFTVISYSILCIIVAPGADIVMCVHMCLCCMFEWEMRRSGLGYQSKETQASLLWAETHIFLPNFAWCCHLHSASSVCHKRVIFSLISFAFFRFYFSICGVLICLSFIFCIFSFYLSLFAYFYVHNLMLLQLYKMESRHHEPQPFRYTR